MIQDIAPRHLDLTYAQAAPEPGDRVLCFRGGEVLLRPDGGYPRRAELPEGTRCQYLFAVDEERFFLGWLPEGREVVSLSWRNARALRGLIPMDRALAGFTAQHLAGWYRANRFCGRCGAPLEPGKDERKLVCPACGGEVYPRINPAVIAAVTDGDRLLMTRYAHGPVKHYVLVAGFVEVGETAEQTVAREVWEETGLRVKNIRYFGSQPWGCAGNLTLGYWAELDGTDRVEVERSELSDARWFLRDQVPVPEDHTSLTSAMIRAFARGGEEKDR